MPARIIHKLDIEALMSAPAWSRSAHFAMHHVAGRPRALMAGVGDPPTSNLSTGISDAVAHPVDKPGANTVWSALVVPKRHARRAVTRNLLKRQMRSAFVRHEAALKAGLWLVRLRRPFATGEFISAASAGLRAASRAELEALFSPPAAAAAGEPRRRKRG